MTYLLIVVDMQADFVTGALGSPEARAIVPAVAQRIRRAREEGTRVLFTLDTHTPDYLSTREGRHLPVVHCVKGTPGWALEPEIASARTPDMPLIEKPTFGSTALAHLAARQAKTLGDAGMVIELCGVCTDICVVSNALLLKAALPEADLVVDSHLCAGVTPEKHAAALETMRSCQIDVK